MATKTRFKSDNKKTPSGKNRALANHLAGLWLNLNIKKIERKKNGEKEGWLVTYSDP